MRLMLKRELFLGGARYRQNNLGTEVPDMVGDREVVLWEKGKKYDLDKQVVLPQDAVLWAPDVKPPVQAVQRRVEGGRPTPVALSQLPGAKQLDPQAGQAHNK